MLNGYERQFQYLRSGVTFIIWNEITEGIKNIFAQLFSLSFFSYEVYISYLFMKFFLLKEYLNKHKFKFHKGTLNINKYISEYR